MSKRRRNSRKKYISWDTFFSPNFPQEKLVENLKKAGIEAKKVYSPYEPDNGWFRNFSEKYNSAIRLYFILPSERPFVVLGNGRLIYASLNQATWHQYEQSEFNTKFQAFLKKYRIR